MSGTSLRQFARVIGVTDKAVRKALRAGVFSDAAVHRDDDGTPVVKDVQLAIADWEKSGRRLRGSITERKRTEGEAERGRPKGTDTAASGPTQTGAAATSAEEGTGDGDDHPAAIEPPAPFSLVDAQTMAMLERARKLRLENEVSEGQLLDVGQVAKEAFEFARVLRENILNVPPRIAAQLAAEPDAAKAFLLLDGALREALEATASTLEALAVNQ